jgi:O-antigen/teichoic acid export membrane protein
LNHALGDRRRFLAAFRKATHPARPRVFLLNTQTAEAGPLWYPESGVEERVSSIKNLQAIGAPTSASGTVSAGDPAATPAAAPKKKSAGTQVFQNTVAQLFGRAASLLLSAGTSVILARYLGRERLGEYGALYAYLGLYTWLATFGLEQILAREASQRRAQAGSIFLTGSVAGVSLAFVGIGLALSLAPWFGYSQGLRLLLLFAAIDVMLLPPVSFVGILFQVDMRQWYAVGFGLFRQSLWLLAVIFLVSGGAGLLWVIACRTLIGVATAALTLSFCWKKEFLPRPVLFSWTEARILLRYGFPVAMSAIAVGVYHRIDQVMLHKMANDQTLGPYVVAVQIAELFSALPVALMSSLFPILSRVASQEEQFRHYLGVSYRFLMLLVFLVCAVLTPIAAPLIVFFYGGQFLLSAKLLVILIWSEVPIFFGVALTSALVARNLQRYLPLSTVIGAVMNVLLNIVLIPRYGALGASWATVVSYCCAGIFLFLIFPATRGFTMQGLRIALPSFLLALGITLALMQLSWPAWWKFLAGCVCFGAGAWLAGAVKRSEFDRVWQLIRGSVSYVRL